MTRILVAGAGVAGLSVALRLLERGHRVTLVERGEVGKESSWAGGGILCPLLPWDYGETLNELALRSMNQYADWVDALETRSGCSAEFWRCGMDISGIGDPSKALEWCATHALAAQPSPAGPGQLRLPDIAQVRNPRLVEALRAAVLQAGGIIHTQCALDSISRQSGRVMSVHTTTGSFTADQVVLTTGAWAGMALPRLAATPNIRPIRGQMLLFKLEPGALETILYRDGLYLIPRRDGHILVGSTLENVGYDKSVDDTTLRQLHQGAAELLPVLASLHPVRHWAGLRPGAPDNIPIIGRHPEFDNVFVNTGQYRYGVTLAPASAEMLVDLMEGDTPVLDSTPFSWENAMNRSWTPAL